MTRGIICYLVFDDFIIKYINKADDRHLNGALASLYKITKTGVASSTLASP